MTQHFLAFFDHLDDRVWMGPEDFLGHLIKIRNLCYRMCNDGAYDPEMVETLLQMTGKQSYREKFKNYFIIEGEHAVSAMRRLDGDTFRVNPLYVHPDHHGEGLGTKIMSLMEGVAQAVGGSRMYIESAMFKKTLDFYHGRGYHDISAPKEYELPNGMKIAVQPMSKSLDFCKSIFAE